VDINAALRNKDKHGQIFSLKSEYNIFFLNSTKDVRAYKETQMKYISLVDVVSA